MSELFERMRREAEAVAAAPLALTAVVVLAILAVAVIFGVMVWAYGAVLSGNDVRIGFLERRVAEYRESVSGATPEQARRRIEALETEIKTLRLRSEPRRLAPAQRQAIVDHSRPPAGAQPYGIAILREESCSDCAAFAADLGAALRDGGGWTVGAEAVINSTERPRTGLGIRVPDRTRPPPEAVILQQALRSAGLAYTMIAGGTAPTVELLITERVPQ